MTPNYDLHVTTHLANPAGRLFWFFESLSQQSYQMQAREAVAKVFDRDWSRDWPLILTYGLALDTGLNETSDWLGHSPRNQSKIALKGLTQSRNVLNRIPEIGNGSALSWFLEGFDGVGLTALELAAAELDSHRAEPVLPGDQVEDLREQVHDLIGDVQGADGLDQQTRAEIVALLRRIEDALLGINVTGYAGVENAVNETVGALRRHPTLLTRLRTHPVVRDVVTFLVALDVMLNMAGNVVGLTGRDAPYVTPVMIEIENLTSVEVGTIEVAGKTYVLGNLGGSPPLAIDPPRVPLEATTEQE